jgi:hypothetical protein
MSNAGQLCCIVRELRAEQFHWLNGESSLAASMIYNCAMLSGWSIAVRVALSLCLVLNGLGPGGVAHARHSFTAESQQAATERAQPATDMPVTGSASSADAPCHGAHATQTTGEPRPTPDSNSISDSDESLPSCCHFAGCSGTCLHHPAGAIASWGPTVFVTRTGGAAVPRTLHVSPELPHLTRPPIS